MKILLDMNLSPRWKEHLVAAGIEAVHWSTLGAGNAPDSAIMAGAAEHDFVLLTHDLDFGSMLAASKDPRPSAIQVRADDISPEAIGAQVIAALRQMSAELAAGALITVEPARTRLRILPFASPGQPT